METPNEFMARAAQDLADWVAENQKLAVDEESIRLRRVELRARITKLLRLREGYEQYMGIHLSPMLDDALLVPGEIAYGPMGTIANMAYRAIVQHGGQMRIKDVVAELTRLGRVGGSHNDYATVYRALSRDSRVERVAPGEFRLVLPLDAAADAEPDGAPGSRS